MASAVAVIMGTTEIGVVLAVAVGTRFQRWLPVETRTCGQVLETMAAECVGTFQAPFVILSAAVACVGCIAALCAAGFGGTTAKTSLHVAIIGFGVAILLAAASNPRAVSQNLPRMLASVPENGFVVQLPVMEGNQTLRLPRNVTCEMHHDGCRFGMEGSYQFTECPAVTVVGACGREEETLLPVHAIVVAGMCVSAVGVLYACADQGIAFACSGNPTRVVDNCGTKERPLLRDADIAAIKITISDAIQEAQTPNAGDSFLPSSSDDASGIHARMREWASNHDDEI